MEYIEDFKNPAQTSYQGPAARVGAGVRTVDVYEFADSAGLMMVGGEQPVILSFIFTSQRCQRIFLHFGVSAMR